MPSPPDAPPPSLPAALAGHAARHPHRPFLFWPEGLDWRWASFAEVAGEVDRLRLELLAASVAAGAAPGAPVAYPERPLPGRVTLDLAIQAAGRTAWPTPGPEPPSAAALWVEVEPPADDEDAVRSALVAGAGPARIALPVDRRWSQPAWRRRPVAARRDEGAVGDSTAGTAGLAGGVLVAELGAARRAMRRIEPGELLAEAERLAAVLAPPDGAGGGRAGRDVVVLGGSFTEPGVRRLLSWAVSTGAAVVLEPSPTGLVATAAWARPTVFRGTAGEIAALEVEARAAEAAGPTGAWRRLRRRLGRPVAAPPRPFRRLDDLLVVGSSPGEGALDFWRRRGVRIHREDAAARRPAGE
jgi:hypothetical protein